MRLDFSEGSLPHNENVLMVWFKILNSIDVLVFSRFENAILFYFIRILFLFITEKYYEDIVLYIGLATGMSLESSHIEAIVGYARYDRYESNLQVNIDADISRRSDKKSESENDNF